MSRIKTNVELLTARRAIDNVHQADIIVTVAEGDLQEVNSLNSLQVARENVTAAGSAVHDADFAVETSHVTRARILVSGPCVGLRSAAPVGIVRHRLDRWPVTRDTRRFGWKL